MEEKLDKLFHLKERGTTVRTEVLAGLTTFVTAAYVLAVNPSVMSATGMDSGAVFTATALVCFLGTLVMALLTNYPFVLVPSMGLNAYFAYTVVLGMGYSWEVALAAIFVEGLVFALISLTSLREKIFKAIPLNLKYAISAGIGLFITIIGLKNSGLVVGNSATCCSVECAAGIAEGGRTGLMAITTGVLFLLSMFLSPIFLAIPSFATAPALVIVGSLMASSVLSIDFGDPTESIPAFLCFVGMPFCYSIVEGISMGIISYVGINLLCGNHKKISPMMYALAVVFILKYVLI